MSALAQALLAELSDADLDQLADRLAPLLAARLGAEAASPWLNAEQSAEYLACTRDRLYDLVQLGKLHPRRDGRRLPFKRADLGCRSPGPTSKTSRAASHSTSR